MIIVALGAALLPACQSSQPLTAIDPMPAETQYQLGPGDKIMVNVFGDKNLSGERQVDGSGAFTFPLIGNVQAGGLSSGQLEALLETKLKEYMRQPNVSVEILSYRPFYIVGEVRRPGSYPYVDGMTVMNAIAIAGGFTYRAQEKDFVIQRNNSSAGAGQVTRIAPGDVIVVRERFF
jgi:polysaccharide export outer membrane protein